MSDRWIGASSSLTRLRGLAICLVALIFSLLAMGLWSVKQDRRWEEAWQFTTKDPAGFYTFALVILGSAQALFFFWQLVLIRKSLADTKDAADAAKKQVELTRDSLIASQRAWIKVTDITFTDGLKIRRDSARSMISFRLTNVGNTPALRVTPWIRLGVIRRDGQAINRFNRECEQIVRMPPPGEFSLFPGEIFPQTPESLVYPVSLQGSDLEAGTMHHGEFTYITPLLLICVLYQFPSDQGRYHQTRMVLEIQNVDLNIIGVHPNTVPAEQLRLVNTSWENSLYAD